MTDHRWPPVVLASMMGMLCLGTGLIAGREIPTVAAQVGTCPQVAATSCNVTPGETVMAMFGGPDEGHWYVGRNDDTDPEDIDVWLDVPRRMLRNEPATLSALWKASDADSVEVRILGADRSELIRGSTSEGDPPLQLRAKVGSGIYALQLIAPGEANNSRYELTISHAGGAQSGPPPAGASCSSPFEVIRGFGLVYHHDARLRRQLGCPQNSEAGYWMAAQPFQRGLMLWRPDTQQIIVLRGADRRTSPEADVHEDKFREGDPEDATWVAPPGLETPIRGFGRLWRDKSDIRQSLGWATRPERSFYGAIQEFERGSMIWTGVDDRLIWVVYENGGSLVFRDLFES